MNNVFYNIFLIFIIMIILLYILTDCDTKLNDRQIWPCPHNDRLKYIYIDKPDDKYTSLSLFDIYSFTHISHGMILFILLNYIYGNKNINMIFITIGWGILWEIIENSDYVLNKYRINNKHQRNYYGDSIINSIGDILCCFIGFTIAWMVPNAKYSFILLILSEIFLYMKMKDNLFTNILQIFI